MTQPLIEYHVKSLWSWGWSSTTVHLPAGTSFAKAFEDFSLAQAVMSDGLSWSSYAWPGGYEIHYITKDCGTLCHHCANKELPRTLDSDDEQFFIVASDINYEDSHLFCDHCNRQIEPCYGDDDADTE